MNELTRAVVILYALLTEKNSLAALTPQETALATELRALVGTLTQRSRSAAGYAATERGRAAAARPLNIQP